MSPVSAIVHGVVASLLLAAAAPATAQEPREIKIGLSSVSFATVPPRAADQLGLFEKHGLKPSFVILESGSAVTTALISGSLEAVVGGPGEHVAAVARGQEIVAVANLYKGPSGSVTLSNAVVEASGVAPDAPVSERLRALDGLAIGAPSATSSYTVAVKTAAEAEGATVRFIYMPQTTTPAALETGAIDGFIAGAPVWSVPVTNGSGVLWLSGPGGDFPPEFAPASSTSVHMMRATAEADPELAAAFAAVSADFVALIETNPEEVKAAVAALYPDLAPETLDLLFERESPALKAPPLTAEDMAHEIAFVKAAGANVPGLDDIDPATMIYP